MQKSYKQVINTFETLAGLHRQVNGFIDNHPLQINGERLTFPVVAIYPGASEIRPNALYLNIKLFVMDLLEEDYSNERDVLSDCLQIGNDFIQKLYQGEINYGFSIDENSITMEPFSENIISTEDTSIEDDVAGWYFEFVVEIVNKFNECTTPFAPPTSTPTSYYYIANVSDIYGVDMTDYWFDVTDNTPVGSTTLEGFTTTPTFEVGTKAYVGWDTSAPITLTQKDKTITLIDGDDVSVDYPTMQADSLRRIAVLTSFTAATFSHSFTGTQETLSIENEGTDLTPTFGTGTHIRITNSSGEVFYDIVENNNFSSPTNTMTTYMGYYDTAGSVLTIEKMTNIS